MRNGWKRVLFLSLAVAPFCHGHVWAATSRQETTQPASQGKVAKQKVPKSVVYVNKMYGFSFTLPQTWKGYSIVVTKWGGSTLDLSAKSFEGPTITIRHPSWTEASPYQDIPIMVFTPAQWRFVEDDNLSVSAAPFGPNEIGRNSKYIFALPPRFNYSNGPGTDEVNQMLQHRPLHPM
jgi:hypothetical protein